MKTRPGGPPSTITAAPSPRPGEAHPAFAAVQDHLRRFGYVADAPLSRGRLDAATSEALARYQAHHGLPVSGTFDAATRTRMAAPRCGMPDMFRAVPFTTTCPWTHPCLTFAFDSGTDDVPDGREFAAVRRAVATWAAATPLTFTEVGLDQHPDIVIGWRTDEDSDYDLTSDVAHADYPPGCGVIDGDALPKPVHFRETGINWSDGVPIHSHDIESVALHELGHIIGLGHSTREQAVMFTPLGFGRTRRALTSFEHAGIRQLYPSRIPQAGVVTIRQARTRRFLDAHEIAGRDFRVVTRPTQDDDTQRWIVTPVGSLVMIRHVSTGRFLDAHTVPENDFGVLTRNPAPADAQRWIVLPTGDGSVTIRQLSTNRLLDAHEIDGLDFAAVTRPAQQNDTQRWRLEAVGPNTFTIRQRSSGRFLDAHDGPENLAVVTRPRQFDDTQRWIIAPVGTVCTIRQRSNGRFLDAHETAAEGFAAVTRPAQGDDTQRWVLAPAAEGSFTIRQLGNGRLLEAPDDAAQDFGALTRPPRLDATQRWFILPARSATGSPGTTLGRSAPAVRSAP